MKILNPFISIKTSLFRTALILGAACLFGLTFNGFRTNSLPLIHTEIKISSDGLLSVRQAYLLYRQGNVVFIDTRYEDEFGAGHIPGAINVPSRLPVDEFMTYLETIGKNEIVVVYCGNIECNSARRFAGFMKQLGFTRVHVFNAGFEGWVEKTLPVSQESNK
jgi:rhodanese-related sulfurtransferase